MATFSPNQVYINHQVPTTMPPNTFLMKSKTPTCFEEMDIYRNSGTIILPSITLWVYLHENLRNILREKGCWKKEWREEDPTFHYLCVIYLWMHLIPRMHLQPPDHHYTSYKDFCRGAENLSLLTLSQVRSNMAAWPSFCQLCAVCMSFNDQLRSTISWFVLFVDFAI